MIATPLSPVLSPETTEAAAPGSALPAPSPAGPLRFGRSRRLSDVRNCTFEIAGTIDGAIDAWHVLYHSYRAAGFVRPGHTQVHTVPQAIGEHALVMLARSQGVPVSTITAINDNPLGLPVEKVYPDEIGEIRGRGGKLMEIGLFGDRRDGTAAADRSFTSVFELMRYTFFFGVHSGVTDFVCGIPPRRAVLYEKCFGFRPIGPEKSYSTVEDAPVVLLHCTTEYAFTHAAEHRALEYFMSKPLPAETFDARCRFDADEVQNSVLAEFLDRPKAPPTMRVRDGRIVAA